MKEADNIFKHAVENTSEVSGAYRTGLEAFGNYKAKIKVPDTSKIGGSIDIDDATTKFYPDDNRWDYAVCYDNEVFYIEVHTASTREVSRVIRKLNWLKNWLISKAPELHKLTSRTKHPFYWIQSSGFDIPKHTSQYKLMIQNKLKPMPVWDYSKL